MSRRTVSREQSVWSLKRISSLYSANIGLNHYGGETSGDVVGFRLGGLYRVTNGKDIRLRLDFSKA